MNYMAYFRLCRHCKRWEDAHADGKCLFDSTMFTSMTEEEFTEYDLWDRAGDGYGTLTKQNLARKHDELKNCLRRVLP
jgi:hypothetical protein